MKREVELTKREERALDNFAKTSPFWSSVRANYALYGSLTPVQYALFQRDLERLAWQRDAQRIGGVPVRNRFRVGKSPRCAHRAERCDDVATVIVGSFGYCPEHAEPAREDLAVWCRERDVERARAKASAGANDDDADDDEEAVS